MDRGAIDAITERQHSLITRQQFLDVTASVATLRWAVTDGWLERFDRWPRLFIVAGATRTEFQPHMAACLLGGRAAAASGLAAGWLWNSPDIAPTPPAITVFSTTARRLQGVEVRRSNLAADAWMVTRHGIPTVAAPLVVVQLALGGAGYLAERVANDFFKRRVTDARSVLDCLELAGRRRHGASRLRAFCERALEVRGHDDSPAARDLGVVLLRAGVPLFVTQHPVSVDGHDYFLDFAWPREMVALEYNGWGDHGITRSAFDSDALRRSRLTAIGWRILDVTSAITDAEVLRWVNRMLTVVDFESCTRPEVDNGRANSRIRR